MPALKFLAFHPNEGFTQSWPVDVMSRVFADLAKKNPKSTVHDVPGPVAFWWDKRAPASHVVFQTASGEHRQTVQPNEVHWLQAGTTVTAKLSSGQSVQARVLATGAVRLPTPKRSPRP